MSATMTRPILRLTKKPVAPPAAPPPVHSTTPMAKEDRAAAFPVVLAQLQAIAPQLFSLDNAPLNDGAVPALVTLMLPKPAVRDVMDWHQAQRGLTNEQRHPGWRTLLKALPRSASARPPRPGNHGRAPS